MTQIRAAPVRVHADTGAAQRTVSARGAEIDAAALFDQLSAAIEGEVRFDEAARGSYSHDASHYRQAPIGVVVPRHERDVIETVRIAREHNAPILARGGGTSLAGQCCNTAVVIDFTKYMNDVLEVDAERRIARVQPGCILDDLRAEAEPHGLTFGPDPSTHNHCAIGGMIGNNSCGVHSVLSEHYGPGPRTEHQVVSMKVLTYDGTIMTVGPMSEDELERAIAAGGRTGEIHAALRGLRDRHAERIRERFPDIPRRVSGYNLPSLMPENGYNLARALVGSESTCVVILEATVRLMWNPPHRVLVVMGFEDAFCAADAVPDVMARKPIGLEGMDRALVADVRQSHLHLENLSFLPDGDGFLLVEFGADTAAEAADQAQRLVDEAETLEGLRDLRMYSDPADAHRIWIIRESGLGATAWIPGRTPTWEGWEDAAVPPEVLGAYLREFQGLLSEYGYHGDLYGHFGQGCVHTRITFDHGTREGLEDYWSFIQDAARMVTRYGGSLSGEHGDGQSRGVLLETMFGPELIEAFREFKRIWDPEGRMNPGKVVDADLPYENLMAGPDYAPPDVETHFDYGELGFAGATLRCVGVGECRRADGGVMCPSYRATREEIHSTRGRARLLYEMMRGETVTDGWRSEAVHEALDLCLACKGCKSDCPVDVDMATYKAEFLSHYYEKRLRPRHAYAFGLIHWWATAASKMPRLVNAVAQSRATSGLAKWVAGAARDRQLPKFADETFTKWYARNRASDGRRSVRPAGERTSRDAQSAFHSRRVILWPDTFNNHFHPETARAGLDVLEHAGFEVTIPRVRLCCGRPLYDYGFLDQAKRQLRRILDVLRPEIEAGTPVVGLEPSCVATFRDELPSLFPHEWNARRLASQTFLLSEFLQKHDVELPRIEGAAVVQAHCHHYSVLDWSAEEALLDRIGLDWSRPEESCCGMAGAFGFDAHKYDLSVSIGERKLLPAVRAAPSPTLVIADGFSCREQVHQQTGRMPQHLAEVLRDALPEHDAAPR